MGDRVVPRAEDGLAPDRHLAAAAIAFAALALVLAGCGSVPYTNATFRNDVGRPVRLGYCGADKTCRHVVWWIGVDPGAEVTEQIPSNGRATRRFVVVGPPEVVFGCFVLHFDHRHPGVTLPMSTARGCGSGR